MGKKNENQEQLSLSGFVGKNGVQFKEFESGKRVANFQIATGSKDNVV